MEKNERRELPRIKTNSLVSIMSLDHTDRSTTHGMGKVLNLSMRGLLVETSRPIPSKTVSLVSVDVANNLTGIQGEVIWTRELSSGKAHSGIRFLGNNLEILNFCKALIKVSCRRRNLVSEVAETI